MITKRLIEGDAAALDRFLARHAESSMFLRRQPAQGRSLYRGERFEGEYLGALGADGSIVGAIAHYWNGSILMQAPEPSVLRALCAALRGAARPCASVLGPVDQADCAIADLGLSRRLFALFGDEGLYALELSGLRAPAAPLGRMRPTSPADAELLRAWMRAYEIEASPGRPPPAASTANTSSRVSVRAAALGRDAAPA